MVFVTAYLICIIFLLCIKFDALVHAVIEVVKMFNWANLGRTSRTKFGRFLDKNGISQKEIEKKAKLSRATVSRLCNDHTYKPKISTATKITRGLNKLGKNVDEREFWM